MLCLELKSALICILMIWCTDQFQVGPIRWPLRLQDNAADHNYRNDAIQTGLYDAYSAIFDILTGATQHPIVTFFSQHMKDQYAAFHEKNRGRLHVCRILDRIEIARHAERHGDRRQP